MRGRPHDPQPFGLVLDAIHLQNQAHCLLRRLRRARLRIVKFAAHVREASGPFALFRRARRVVAGVRVHHERPVRAAQHRQRRLARPARGKAITDAVARQKSPHVRPLGLARCLHLQRCFIGLHDIFRGDFLHQRVVDRLEQFRRQVEKLAQRPVRHRHTRAGKHLRQTVQWNRIRALAHHRVRAQARAVLAAVDDLGRRRRRHDMLAAPARQHMAHVHAVLEVPRHVLPLLAHLGRQRP